MIPNIERKVPVGILRAFRWPSGLLHPQTFNEPHSFLKICDCQIKFSYVMYGDAMAIERRAWEILMTRL